MLQCSVFQVRNWMNALDWDCTLRLCTAVRRSTQVEFKLVYGPGARQMLDHSTAIYKISIGRMALMFQSYIKFKFNMLANILY